MKLSEAILLGSTVLTAKAGGQHFSGGQAGCALGMAEAMPFHESLAVGFIAALEAVLRSKVRLNGTAPTGSRGCSNWYRTLFAKQLYVNPAVGDVQEDSLKVE
jgi:hypothetical protein